MHIAFLTPEYPHSRVLHSAGIGTSIKNLAVALTQKGVKVSVFVYGQNEALDFEEEGVKLHLIKTQKYKILGCYLHRKYIQNHLNTLIISEHIDLVEAPDWTGITAFMNLKVPLVIRFHGSDAYFCHLENRKQKLKNYWFEKLAFQKAKAFIAPTTFAGQLSQKIFNIKNKTIQTIHNGLDLHFFQNSNPENFEKKVILYIGTIIRKKGVLELAAIFNLVRQKHPGASLVLIGSDSFDIATQSKSTWELMQKEFKDNDFEKVSYLGKIPYQAVLEHLKKAHVCVYPTFAETLGMVTIESMAMQKPVVNSNIGWAKEIIVDGESGYLVHPKDHQLFANRINSVFENTDLMIQIGNQARERVEAKFDIEKIAIENITFFKSLIV
ncbi:glycosyltransferase involved in cell wall biosynthesis [Flavobacterium limicola]|uniref:Glycosyltransferase involved in cell wall biosynthesis n=1 Tax=Flavobacterium limicola TaxID=180441 RepID=A0A495RQZ4_9FLAO|nr:glycosyltransferase family 4 protein [Flavobacterium limicola]RKS89664.1 glycosyltransferase involved in cell wall biosynthesis [Flavobacterium limicola]